MPVWVEWWNSLGVALPLCRYSTLSPSAQSRRSLEGWWPGVRNTWRGNRAMNDWLQMRVPSEQRVWLRKLCLKMRLLCMLVYTKCRRCCLALGGGWSKRKDCVQKKGGIYLKKRRRIKEANINLRKRKKKKKQCSFTASSRRVSAAPNWNFPSAQVKIRWARLTWSFNRITNKLIKIGFLRKIRLNCNSWWNKPHGEIL